MAEASSEGVVALRGAWELVSQFYKSGPTKEVSNGFHNTIVKKN